MNSMGQIQEWVEALRRGEPESWERLRGFVRACVARASGPIDAREQEEITCDTLSAVWETLGRLRDSAKLLAVVRTITRRLYFRRLKAARRCLSLGGDVASPDEVASGAPEAQELYDLLIASLEVGDRKLFGLLYVDGASRDDLEAQTGAQGSALRKKKHFLHKKLRAVLRRYGAGGERSRQEPPTAAESPRDVPHKWDGRIEDL